MKEYKLIGPATNLSAGDAKCFACPGDGMRVQPGSVPEKCSVCNGTGKISGLLKQVNEAAAEGWVYAGSHATGTPGNPAHLIFMERDKAEEKSEAQGK